MQKAVGEQNERHRRLKRPAQSRDREKSVSGAIERQSESVQREAPRGVASGGASEATTSDVNVTQFLRGYWTTFELGKSAE